MVFIGTMKTILLKTNKQHQSILGANSKEEFPRRRARLKKQFKDTVIIGLKSLISAR